MKRILTTLIVALMMAVQANAMSYEQARREALFLTDKMAYELNLTQDQYDAAYEINLDYLMGVTSVDDVYSAYWTRRNLDLSYILLDWQWSAYRAATYFYRPLYWDAGYWHFGVYARYPHRTFFYFDRPGVYVSYRGGHSWHSNGGHSYYMGRRDDFRSNGNFVGMRDRWEKGDFRNTRSDGRNSSTRITVNRDNASGTNNSGFSTSSFGGSRTSGTFSNRGQSATNRASSTTARTSGTFSGQRGTTTGNQTFTIGSSSSSRQSTTGSSSFGGSRTSGTFGSSRIGSQRQSTSSSSSQGTFSAQRSSTFNASGAAKSATSPSRSSSTTFGGSRTSGTFGGQRSSGSFGASSGATRATVSPSGGSGSFGGSRSGGSSSGGTFSGRR